MEQQRNREAPLVPTNEKLCIAAQNGDEEAANLLLERNVKFVKLVVRAVLNLFGIKPRDIGISYDDLVSEGQLGMWKCIAKYDPTQPANFLTYAKPSVRHSVTDLVRERLRETESQRTRITFEEVENRYAEG